MKRLALILSLCLFFSLGAKSQTQQDSIIAIPNGSFETWSTGSGYNVAVIFQVYDSYTYPTGWDIPTYPVNQTFSYFTINTNLPLIKINNVSSDVVEGSHALRIQSFMLSDIIGSTVYNMAASSLDPMMTNSIFPTILSTGVVDVMEFLPMMYDITSNFGNIAQLLSLLDGVDINTLVEGGIPLNGAVPGRMTGYYKYTSAPGGDNGGILMLGTKYNTTTHRREVVGAGYTIALTDTSEYTSFELEYSPLSQINPNVTYEEADSLVIFLFSSANATPRQGSTLYLDDLRLFAGEAPQPDTCSAIFDLTLSAVDTSSAAFSWSHEGEPDHFQVEFGFQGFQHGNGMQLSFFEDIFSVNGLQPDTWYDLYVRCVCDDELYGEWAMVSFHTDTLVPPVVIPIDTTGDTTSIMRFSTNLLSVYPNPAHGQCEVHFPQEIPQVVRLYTIDGALILEVIPNKESIKLELPSKGIFILSCEMKEGTLTRKIVNQ